MVQILIDTNVFLHFYNAKNEMLVVLDEVLKYSDQMVLSEQIVTEFRRNRANSLRRLAKAFEKPSKAKIEKPVKGEKEEVVFETALTKTLTELAELKKEMKTFNEKSEAIHKKIVSNLIKMIEVVAFDPVAKNVEALYNKNLPIISINDKDFENAKRRKALGNPPFSPGKETIGDEIIWEGILSQISGDLVFVTRDKKGFDSYKEILCEEFKRKKGRTLHIVSQCKEAIKIVGGKVPEKVAEVEEKDTSEYKSVFSDLFPDQVFYAGGKLTGLLGGSLFNSDSLTGYYGTAPKNLILNSSLDNWANVTSCDACHEFIPIRSEKCPACGKDQA